MGPLVPGHVCHRLKSTRRRPRGAYVAGVRTRLVSRPSFLSWPGVALPVRCSRPQPGIDDAAGCATVLTLKASQPCLHVTPSPAAPSPRSSLHPAQILLSQRAHVQLLKGGVPGLQQTRRCSLNAAGLRVPTIRCQWCANVAAPTAMPACHQGSRPAPEDPLLRGDSSRRTKLCWLRRPGHGCGCKAA